MIVVRVLITVRLVDYFQSLFLRHVCWFVRWVHTNNALIFGEPLPTFQRVNSRMWPVRAFQDDICTKAIRAQVEVCNLRRVSRHPLKIRNGSKCNHGQKAHHAFGFGESLTKGSSIRLGAIVKQRSDHFCKWSINNGHQTTDTRTIGETHMCMCGVVRASAWI